MKKIISILTIALIMISSVCFAKVTVPETIRVKMSDGTIQTIDFDEYLYGVVSSEMGTSYTNNGKSGKVGLEALKAQAVASRSYAMSNINPNKDFDVTSTTSSQVYKAGNVADIVKQAVDETHGEVMTYDGKVICAYFFACSGGHTESPENVWTNALPYLIGVKDPYEIYVAGRNEWEARIPYDKYGKIKILERDENDRVISLKVGSKTLSKNNIRTTLGASLIKSTWFKLDYDEETDEYVFTGKGFGHGVGMSQYGAIGMAAKGYTYDEILHWYYTDVEIENESLDKTTTKSSKTSDDSTKTEAKDYGSSTVTVKKEKEKGPLLIKILNVIDSFESIVNPEK